MLHVGIVLCYNSSKVCGQLFPRAIGGTGGDTHATAFDMTDDGLNAVIGGVSYAEDVIMSTSPLSFITYFAGPMMS